MQLLKMELRGFKSFADKTTLTFDKGITAIVGPNGSGKSNISDAIRWVMGEQNVRQLRGQKAEDVIFAGTEKRRPAGACEVSLYFDNTDHTLDVDFTEVVITRRYFRSGDSEFYINKRSCRLKDIHQLFADTGIGQDSMAVIGQNRVDRILNSKPEERRIIFEEVAGISRYKGRKAEGLRKIAETDRNLERIGDMMAVLSEQLGPLEAEAQKLISFRKLDSERIDCEGTLTLQELRNSERLLSKAENSRAQAMTEAASVQSELAGKEKEKAEVVKSLADDQEKMRQIDEAVSKAHEELESLKSRYEACVQRQGDIKASLDDGAKEGQRYDQKLVDLQRQRDDLKQQQEQKNREWDAAKKGLALVEELFGQAEAKAQQAAADLSERMARQGEQERQLFTAKRDAGELRRRLDESQERRDELKKNRDAKAAEADTLAAQSEKIKSQLTALEAEVETLRQTVQDGRSREEQLRSALYDADQAMREAQSEGAALAQRIRVLEGLEQEHEGVGRAQKIVLSAKVSWRSHICGVVGELCRVPKDYATAIDVALGAASHHVVTETEDVAKAAISFLKERHGGRATFLPLDTIRPRQRSGDEERAAQEPGILGFASDVISYETRYAPIFSSLLGKTLLADTMETGSRVSRRFGHRLRIVCLDGTQYNIGGSLTGGSMKNREGSFISRRVLLEDLKKQYDDSSEKAKKLSEGRAGRSQAIDELAATLDAQKTALGQKENLLEQLRWQAGQQAKAHDDAQSAAASFEEALQSLDGQRARLQTEVLQKDEDIKRLQDVPSEDMEEWEKKRSLAVAEAEQCRKDVTERQIAAATLETEVQHVKERLEQLAEWEDQARSDKQHHETIMQGLAEQADNLAAMAVSLQDNTKKKEKEKAEKEAQKDAFYAERDKLFARSRALDEALTELRSRQQLWQDRVHSSDVQLEKYRGDIAHHEERLALQGLTRQQAMERRREGTLKELHERVDALKGEIASLGVINPNAEEDYKNAREKETFYNAQCDDLRESRKRLETVVAEIDKAMAEQFGAAFVEIGKHFQRIFGQLFGGGQAKLTLTEAENILQSGVEIYIQPPGKKQQQLTLLSGGERALTVIALLLSFLAYHPAPFCFVDEVDAALDEANVERMGKYLKNYSGQTQFIVITHRRKTMEAANTLQGVTMEEKGISKLLTVKVDELLEKGT